MQPVNHVPQTGPRADFFSSLLGLLEDCDDAILCMTKDAFPRIAVEFSEDDILSGFVSMAREFTNAPIYDYKSGTVFLGPCRTISFDLA